MQGVVFGLVGFTAGVLGTSLSNGLIALRKKMDPNYEAQVSAASLVYRGLTGFTGSCVDGGSRGQRHTICSTTGVH